MVLEQNLDKSFCRGYLFSKAMGPLGTAQCHMLSGLPEFLPVIKGSQEINPYSDFPENIHAL